MADPMKQIIKFREINLQDELLGCVAKLVICEKFGNSWELITYI